MVRGVEVFAVGGTTVAGFTTVDVTGVEIVGALTGVGIAAATDARDFTLVVVGIVTFGVVTGAATGSTGFGGVAIVVLVRAGSAG